MMYQPLLTEYALNAHRERLAASEKYHRLFRRPVEFIRPASGLAPAGRWSDGSSPSAGECCSAPRVA